MSVGGSVRGATLLSRDARLKAAVRERHSAVVTHAGDPALIARLREAWREEAAPPRGAPPATSAAPARR